MWGDTAVITSKLWLKGVDKGNLSNGTSGSAIPMYGPRQDGDTCTAWRRSPRSFFPPALRLRGKQRDRLVLSCSSTESILEMAGYIVVNPTPFGLALASGTPV